MCVAGKNTGAMRDWAMSTKVDTSRFRWRATSISGLWPDTLSATRSRQSRLASGGMAVVKLVATLSSYGRRAVVVGGVADRYASELARAGQSNRQRAGTGSASSECATRPPLWPAGMAEGNRETFGPRSRPIGPRVAREGWAEIKMPRPGEDRSDVGGAAQFNNIGPVPLPAPKYNLYVQ